MLHLWKLEPTTVHHHTLLEFGGTFARVRLTVFCGDGRELTGSEHYVLVGSFSAKWGSDLAILAL